MKNASPIIYLIIGVALIWAGATGRLGTILAALFSPTDTEVS